MISSYALILTGEVLPGFTPEAVWPRLAADFDMTPEKLAELQARAPQIIRRNGDPGKLQALQERIAQCGGQTEIYPPDDRPDLFVLIDNAPRGPVPRELVERYLARGAWAADALHVAEDGSTQWVPYAQVDDALPLDPPFAPPSAPVPYPGGAMVMTPSSHTAPVWEEELSGGGKVLPVSNTVHVGFWRRLGAFIADSMILSTFTTTLPMSIISFAPSISAVLICTILICISQWLYFALMESSSWQATLGKRMMSIKVTDKHGRRISFGRATGRYFGKILSGIIFSIGFMMAGWTGRKQALHDMMVGTFVVFDRVQPDQPLPDKRPLLPWYGWLFVAGIPAFYAVIGVVGGIVAVIAMPYYQKYTEEYTVRVQVAEALHATDTIRSEIAQQGCRSGSRVPPRPWIGTVDIQGAEETESCTITLTMGDGADVPDSARGKIIELERDNKGDWLCSSSLPERYLPQNCR